ncbi:unnamed protein product [Schistosoma curassoni]|uniref:DUF1963 domain-containing protein n=1 Tax=Schistosoma curassoni TaxID=6186 RepID=A0A183KUB2_9TREM|nr:unnamed protein product [Schistosoma curassoni]
MYQYDDDDQLIFSMCLYALDPFHRDHEPKDILHNYKYLLIDTI